MVYGMLAVEQDGLADHRRVGIELPSPEQVVEHDDAARLPAESSSRAPVNRPIGRTRTEQREVVGAHRVPPGVEGARRPLAGSRATSRTPGRPSAD